MGEDFQVVDVEALERKLRGKMSGNLTMSPTCSIFRIPTILVRHCPNAYAPNQFSFGPFHHRDPNLKQTEKIKSKYLLDLLSRLSASRENKFDNSTDRNVIFRGLTSAVAGVCGEAREYYAGPVHMDADEFAEVLSLDGCFIIELLRKKAYESLQGKDDPIFSMPCFLQFLCHDMILLENQVPWMVLEKLFNLSETSIDDKSLVQLTIEFFGTMFSKTQLPNKLLVSELHQSKHILDLLRNALVVPSRAGKHKNCSWEEPMHSATILDESGIKFKAIERVFDSVLDIRFDKRKGVLEIPALLIQETTQTVLRNLIAFEQCCPNYKAVITSYAILLDNLINSRADMELLCKSKAMSTWLNIDDATKFFDKLYIDTYVNDMYYHDLIDEVNGYCKLRWHRWRRVLMRDYFNHPWALVSLIAAVIALVLTFLQTLFAIIKD